MNTIEYFKALNWKEIKPLDILKGCSEAYFSDIYNRGEVYDTVVKYRLKICSNCPLFTGSICDPTKKELDVNGKEVSGCGCNITCKTALKDSECPRKLWRGVK